jgi:hypothetical protein
MTRHPNPGAATGTRGTTSDGGAAVSVSKRRLNSSISRSAKLRSRSVDNNWIRSPDKLRLSSMLTVKIRQPSHEFTFGVGMSFIPYPLVLTPVV